MKQGWIKIHRKLLECDDIWDYDEPYTRRDAWIELLLLANHSDKSIIFDNHRIIVKRGQYLTSVRKLSARWQWGKHKTLNFLRLLEECEMIEKESDSRRTLITIVNYGIYQATENEEGTVKGQLGDSEGTVKGQSLATNKNDKECNKNEKNEKNTPYNPPKEKYFPNNESLNNAFEEFIKMRKQIKKPMGDHAIKLAIKKLHELSGGNEKIAIDIVNQSTMNDWQSFYPLKDDNRPINNKSNAKSLMERLEEAKRKEVSGQ